MRLGTLAGQAHSQLDGFKSRALRSDAPTRRHAYIAEWRSLATAQAQHAVTLVIGSQTRAAQSLSSPPLPHVFEATACGNDRVMVTAAVATRHACNAALPLPALEVALAVVQAPMACRARLLTATMHASRKPQHAGSWGLARSARAEASLPVGCIDGASTAAVERLQTAAEPEALLRRNGCLVPRLARTPVVAVPPVFADRAHPGLLHTLRAIRDELGIGPACAVQALGGTGEIAGIGNGFEGTQGVETEARYVLECILCCGGL